MEEGKLCKFVSPWMLNSAIELIVKQSLSPQLISSAAIRNEDEEKTIHMRELIEFFS